MAGCLPYAVEIYKILFENQNLHSVVCYGYGRTGRHFPWHLPCFVKRWNRRNLSRPRSIKVTSSAATFNSIIINNCEAPLYMLFSVLLLISFPWLLTICLNICFLARTFSFFSFREAWNAVFLTGFLRLKQKQRTLCQCESGMNPVKEKSVHDWEHFHSLNPNGNCMSSGRFGIVGREGTPVV